MNQPADECKTRWRNVRDTFMRRKRSKKKMTTGSANSRKPRKLFLEDSLQFLHQVESERTSITNIVIPEHLGEVESDQDANSQAEEREIEEPDNDEANGDSSQPKRRILQSENRTRNQAREKNRKSQIRFLILSRKILNDGRNCCQKHLQ